MDHSHHAADMAPSSMSMGTFFTLDSSSLYFLYSAFPIATPLALFFAYLATALMAWTERTLTYVQEKQRYSDSDVLVRTYMSRLMLYTILIILRYHLMLLIMLYHYGIFWVLVTTL
jgi:mannose/fructose/N-acetylgalactosamine-specific phosphotransferase system component IIC